MIRALLFDIDGVLIDSTEANIVYFKNLIGAAGYKLPSRRVMLKHMHMTLFDQIRTFTGETSKAKLHKIFEIAINVDYPNQMIKIQKNENKVIQMLHKDYKLGIVTNRVRMEVEEFFEVVKIKKYFQTIIAVEDCSKHKPDPEPLLLAAKRLEIKPNECIYIGDTLSDMQAAKDAKMKFILYSKTPLNGSNVRVESFDQLHKAIENYRSKDF